ncbi:MAG: hypothetical protein AAB451_00810 [Patescibacteria group bacterium]
MLLRSNISDRLSERLDEFFWQGGQEKTGQGVAEMKAEKEKKKDEKNENPDD